MLYPVLMVRLAVQLAERIVIYELYSGDQADMHYRYRHMFSSCMYIYIKVHEVREDG